jgi:hypothetical protein
LAALLTAYTLWKEFSDPKEKAHGA